MPVAIQRIETVYKGFLRVLIAHMSDGAGATFERAVEDHGPGCAVLPYCPETRTALLVRLPRAPVLLSGDTEAFFEAPAGLVDPDEEPDQAAMREAQEEVGVTLKSVEPLGTIWSMPGISTEKMSLFLGRYAQADRTGPGGGLAEENENITVDEVPLAELARLADTGGLLDMRTLALVQTLRLRQPDLFA